MSSLLLQGATLSNAQGETRAGEELGQDRVLALYFAVRLDQRTAPDIVQRPTIVSLVSY